MMSMINTAPRDRMPVKTEILPFDEETIVDAVLREPDRGGQVYFVHNRVQTILAMAAYLGKLVPELRIGVAHGQMPERQIERVMMDFHHGEYDVVQRTSEPAADLPELVEPGV